MKWVVLALLENPMKASEIGKKMKMVETDSEIYEWMSLHKGLPSLLHILFLSLLILMLSITLIPV